MGDSFLVSPTLIQPHPGILQLSLHCVLLRLKYADSIELD
jgi:hypothetical protein